MTEDDNTGTSAATIVGCKGDAVASEQQQQKQRSLNTAGRERSVGRKIRWAKAYRVQLILNMAARGPMDPHGGLPEAISRIVAPRDQTSAFIHPSLKSCTCKKHVIGCDYHRFLVLRRLCFLVLLHIVIDKGTAKKKENGCEFADGQPGTTLPQTSNSVNLEGDGNGATHAAHSPLFQQRSDGTTDHNEVGGTIAPRKQGTASHTKRVNNNAVSAAPLPGGLPAPSRMGSP